MGEDKALMEWRGKPLWLVQLDKLCSLGASHVIVACREEQHLCNEDDSTHATLFYDPPNDGLGPMGVISRALNTYQMPVLVLAVDMPSMTLAFLKSKIAIIENVGRCFESEHGLEPMAALYVPAMLPLIEESIAAGQLSLQKLLRRCVQQELLHVQKFSEVEKHLFSNVNTQIEWRHEKGRSSGPA